MKGVLRGVYSRNLPMKFSVIALVRTAVVEWHDRLGRSLYLVSLAPNGAFSPLGDEGFAGFDAKGCMKQSAPIHGRGAE